MAFCERIAAQCNRDKRYRQRQYRADSGVSETAGNGGGNRRIPVLNVFQVLPLSREYHQSSDSIENFSTSIVISVLLRI